MGSLKPKKNVLFQKINYLNTFEYGLIFWTQLSGLSYLSHTFFMFALKSKILHFISNVYYWFSVFRAKPPDISSCDMSHVTFKNVFLSSPQGKVEVGHVCQ